ncbi:hypothetical protein LTR70_000703 [Exophiala xenobiotica]|uniref:Domain of unknown function at the cortex 1 domain-containing protein n=1 Tax=Lithohypha guttulata TaxID=1690604 RepID=A0ABR0KNE6_9EURO|nr:hypothetical protein LTR24_000626 [Lithohypha guttulata]KAK5329206.1 hypothetical protein LTR70_000703 [Exophiala xenobiotica]
MAEEAASKGPLDHTKYRLRVTAGPAYDSSTHKVVKVNSPETLTFENEHIIISLAVRLKRFTGFPSSSPQTSSYFEHQLHKGDQYSIAFSFIPKLDIPGTDLVFGNDFDRPIRDRLPPGTNQAFKFVKWWIDPGLEGDMYADKPYLYGAALSSFNYLRICDKIVNDDKMGEKDAWKIPNATSFHEAVVEEGAEGDGQEERDEAGLPADAAARKKHFLTRSNLENFVFQKGRLYQSDFGNGYLDFNDFALKLPGFTVNVINYVDTKTHELRYTLKNMKTGEVYCVVLFTLLFGEELEEMARQEGGDNAGTNADELASNADDLKEDGGKDGKKQDVDGEAPSADDVD